MAELGVEWINDYDHLNTLTHEHTDAGGFYDELTIHDGWTGDFNWGNANAWASDFISKDAGGDDVHWVDEVDIAYFTGHGGPFGFYFKEDTSGNPSVFADNHSADGAAGNLRLGDVDLEWLALEVCNVLQWEANRHGKTYNAFDRWRGTFQGLHTICSFTTVSLDMQEPGRYFAAFCNGRWMEVVFGFGFFFGARFPMTVIDSWFQMTSTTQPSQYEAAVMYAFRSGESAHGDYIHGHGDVCSDPQPGSGQGRCWIPHQC